MIAKFSLPCFYSKFSLVKRFIQYYIENRNKFYYNRIINSFYDTNDTLIWRGGRNIIVQNPPSMEEILQFFNQHPEIELRYTFTNTLLDKELIKDENCNKFVNTYIRSQDRVILNHPLLIQHFKQNYSQIPIIYSTTLNIIDLDIVNKITEKNIYVINYNYNNDDIYLNNLVNKNNIEIICAEPCEPYCPERLNHYNEISRCIITNDKDHVWVCPFNSEGRDLEKIMSLPHAIDNKRIDQLMAQGFFNFKISGRTLTKSMWLKTILYYLALPQYIDNIIADLS